MVWLMSPGRAWMLPIRVSNFVSRVTILFSKSSLLSFKSEIMSYMMFCVWKTGLREIEKQRTRLNDIGPGGKLSVLRTWGLVSFRWHPGLGMSTSWTHYLTEQIQWVYSEPGFRTVRPQAWIWSTCRNYCAVTAGGTPHAFSSVQTDEHVSFNLYVYILIVTKVSTPNSFCDMSH